MNIKVGESTLTIKLAPCKLIEGAWALASEKPQEKAPEVYSCIVHDGKCEEADTMCLYSNGLWV